MTGGLLAEDPIMDRKLTSWFFCTTWRYSKEEEEDVMEGRRRWPRGREASEDVRRT